MRTKKAAVVLFLGACFLSSAALAAKDVSVFEQANAKYRAGDYPAAVSLYKKAISDGRATEVLYYNLGNAAFRAGNKGEALVAYERASRLNPRDKDIEWNKGVLKSVLVDRVDESRDNVFISSVHSLLQWITADEAAAVFALVLGALFVISLLNFSFHRSKSLTAGIGGLFVFLLVLSGAVFYFKWTQVKDPLAVVLEKEVAARYGPSDKETKAFVLHEGAEARVKDETGDWYYVVLKNNDTGWVPKKSCEIV